jgi:hypothetical protein
MKLRYVLGIDGGTKTGFAVWDRKERKFVDIKTTSFWKFFPLLDEFGLHPQNTNVYVENPSENKPVFMKKGVKNMNMMLKVAQNVGGVKRETELLIEGLENAGFDVIKIPPRKGSYTKMKAEPFKNLTKYDKKTSEHGRDAGMLVFNR